MIISDRLLFLRYALPCAFTLVNRGNVPAQDVENAIELVSHGKLPAEGFESIFKVANVMCEQVATRMGKKEIDSEVIRQYFLFEHSPVVEDRYKLMKDFNPVDCKTYPGKVAELNTSTAIVETRIGRREYRTDFERDVRIGDVVVVHFDFIVEKIPGTTAEKMEMAAK